MTGTRRRGALLIAAALLLAVAAAFAWTRGGSRAGDDLRPRNERPVLLLLTSLPLMFGDEFSLDSAGSPVLEALERRYRVEAIATTSAKELSRGDLLLMAHPLAQPAENLVALDRWVRAGGRLLLLADPMLEWQDRRPLGDPTRPPPMFADTGLLGHWGLTLAAPETRGPRGLTLAGRDIESVSPGTLSGDCAISPDRVVAQCAIGKGRVTVVADADFLDWTRGGKGEGNRRALLAALESLESARSD